MSKAKVTLHARIGEGEDARIIRVEGRPAWLLRKLVDAGERGLTTAQLPPGVRVSDSIFKLRTKHIVGIETVYEAHGGSFPGSHGVYKLRSPVAIIEDVEAAA